MRVHPMDIITFKRRNIERDARYLGEMLVTGSITYGQIFARDLITKMTFQLTMPQFYLACLGSLYAADMVTYSIWYPKLYDYAREYGMSRAADYLIRGTRDLSMLLVNAGGMALYYYILLNSSSMPLQITTIVGISVLKGFIDFTYDAFDLTRHAEALLETLSKEAQHGDTFEQFSDEETDEFDPEHLAEVNRLNEENFRKLTERKDLSEVDKKIIELVRP